MEGEVKVNNEIEQMLNALGDPTPEDLKGDEEDDKKEESSEEKKEDESKEDSSEEKEDEEKSSEEPSKEDKEEEKKEDKEENEEEETDKDKIIENLRQRLNEKSETPEKKETQEEIERKKADEAAQLKAEEEARKKAEPLKLDEQDFIGDLDLDDLTRDKAALNKILNTVYAKGVNDSKRIATEGVLSSIPEIVKHNLTLLTTLKEASDNFYKENKDLAPFKRVVAAVFEEIAAKNPDKKYSELMNLTAPEARKRLELHKQAAKKEEGNDGKGKPPRLPGAKSGQRQTPLQKPNTSALENEISEMNKTLRR